MSESRNCPECGEKLSFEARRCACGWGARKGEKVGREFDHRCTYRAGGDRCQYPVGMFTEGATSGWCIFHRNNTNPAAGQEIVDQSARVPYLDAIKAIQARNADSAGVRATRAELKPGAGN